MEKDGRGLAVPGFRRRRRVLIVPVLALVGLGSWFVLRKPAKEADWTEEWARNGREEVAPYGPGSAFVVVEHQGGAEGRHARGARQRFAGILPGMNPDEAEGYGAQIIESRVLVPECKPPATRPSRRG